MTTSSDGFAATALEIGRTIAAEALWHDGRCNWVGADVDPAAEAYGMYRVLHRALGSDLYGGTSGIAMFLADLHAATEDAKVGATARGAAAQALAHAERAGLNGGGFHSGPVGTAYAVSRAGRALGDAALVEGAYALARAAAERDPPAGEFDVISGAAGEALGLLALHRLHDDPLPLEGARRRGDALIETARRSDRGWSWRAPHESWAHDLCGLSHGAAGAGVALVELFAATGDERYSAAAAHAFEYERSWFDPDAGNWPDLRSAEPGDARPRGFVSLWCHGAPGIALSRLRAWQVLGGDDLREEATVALATTAADVERTLAHGVVDMSLCHGLGGNIDVLATGAEALGGEEERLAALAREAARAGMALEGRWPCGLPGGDTPNLYLGRAGIGAVYLRLGEPGAASPLTLG